MHKRKNMMPDTLRFFVGSSSLAINKRTPIATMSSTIGTTIFAMLNSTHKSKIVNKREMALRAGLVALSTKLETGSQRLWFTNVNGYGTAVRFLNQPDKSGDCNFRNFGFLRICLSLGV